MAPTFLYTTVSPEIQDYLIPHLPDNILVSSNGTTTKTLFGGRRSSDSKYSSSSTVVLSVVRRLAPLLLIFSLSQAFSNTASTVASSTTILKRSYGFPFAHTLKVRRRACDMTEFGQNNYYSGLVPDQFCSRLFDILRQNFAALPTIFCWAMLRFTDILLEFCSALLRFVGTLPDAMASTCRSVYIRVRVCVHSIRDRKIGSVANAPS